MSEEREFLVEKTLRDLETQPNWQRQERNARLQDALHCLENDLPFPSNNEVCPPEWKEQMISVIKGLMEL